MPGRNATKKRKALSVRRVAQNSKILDANERKSALGGEILNQPKDRAT